jgi:lipoprotein-releasing system permease protein
MSRRRPAAGEGRRLPRGPLPWIIAWRFLRGRKSRLLDGTARAALAATALGVTAMIIAMALMTGYREDLQRKLIEGNAPVVAQPLLARADGLDPEVERRLEAIPGVERIGRVAYGQGTLAAGEPAAGGPGAGAAARNGAGAIEVTLRGVDPGGGQLTAGAEELGPTEGGVPGAVVGSELARKLGVGEGGLVRLVALGFADGRPRFHYQSLRVTGTFTSGYAEFDAAWVLVSRDLVRRLGGGEGVELLEFTLDDAGEAGRVSERAGEILGSDWLVTDWRLLNQGLFTALQVQQFVLFLMLGLIVVVSTFNVGSTLVVLVRDRMRDIGVLGALGLSPGALRRVFVTYGAVLGAAGIALGVVVGTGAAWVLTTFDLIRFDAEVAAIYFISSVPVRVEAADLAAVVGFAFAVNLLACLLPARRAARLDPSTALRYE